MTTARNISRRQFIQLSSMATAGLIASACSTAGSTPDSTDDAQPAPEVAESASQAGEAAPGQYNEAPMLADLVAAGDLPPVNERLPVNPTMVPVVESIGQYGGTLRRGFRGVSDRWGPTKIQDSSMIRYDLDLVKHPDLIESWEYNDDATSIVLNLREGLKWSDGVDFDSNAFTWWYDHVAKNETSNLRPACSLLYR